MVEMVVRQAHAEDAPALRDIYAPYVRDTAISFEMAVPTIDEFSSRLSAHRGHKWLLAESGGAVLGYAYSGPHRQRAAYRYSVETSVYVTRECHRRGVGRTLYGQLLDDLTERGYCNAFAGITLPNEASVAFHRGMGFSPIGVFHSVGYKFGVWHDVLWLEKRLRGEPIASDALA